MLDKCLHGIRRIALPLLLTPLALGEPAQAQWLPGQEDSLALVSIIAEQGEACGLLHAWEAAGLQAQAVEGVRARDSESRARIIETRRARLAEMTCDNDLLNAWIEGARPNFDSEVLPPYLIVYRVMARMDVPPTVFAATALRLDYAPAIAAIDRKIEMLEASGRPAEGGADWPEYVRGIETHAREFAALVTGEGEVGRTSRDQAAGWIAQSAMITELWLAQTRESGAQ